MIKIEIWSDINCPYCYIGKRNLERALEQFSQVRDVQKEWKSFELDPHTIPPKNISSVELLAFKYGRDRQWAQSKFDSITLLAREVGLDFKLDRMIAANSFDAHRLIHFAKNLGLQDEMKEKLLSLKFIEGKDIGDRDVLRTAAGELGLGLKVGEMFSSQAYSADVRLDEEKANLLGISAVPHFIFNKTLSVSGARPADVFLTILNKVGNFNAHKSIDF